MLPYSQPWLAAWTQAAYGPGGFWHRQSPAAHFRTAAGSTTVLADMIDTLLAERSDITAVVDLGAGDGDLLDDLADLRPDLRLVGIDLRDRPAGLAENVQWRRDLWDVETSTWRAGELDRALRAIGRPALITCVEWLDDLPCPVIIQGSDGWRRVRVDPSGAERPGDRVSGEESRWLEEWWPTGVRAEVGSTRDNAWSSVITSLRPCGGLALMIDYGHLRSNRPAGGSLAAYRDGRTVPVMARADRNLTAAVAVDAVLAAGERAGARTVLLARQAELLDRSERARSLSAPCASGNGRIAPGSGAGPALRDLGGRNPLADLADRSERAALRSPGVWGGQWWLLQEI